MILCCGEALIDMIPERTGTGRVGFVPHTGGSVLNTVIALARQGTRTDLPDHISGGASACVMR